MITVNSNETIYTVISKHPDIKEIMVQLGFKDVVKKGMLQSVGRIMTIKKGCDMKRISFDLVKETFSNYNYDLVEEKLWVNL